MCVVTIEQHILNDKRNTNGMVRDVFPAGQSMEGLHMVEMGGGKMGNYEIVVTLKCI